MDMIFEARKPLHANPPGSHGVIKCIAISKCTQKNGNATSADIALDAEHHGWKCVEVDGINVLTPEWDSGESIAKMDAIKRKILQKCGCKKTKCATNACTCFRDGKECTKLCICVDCSNDIPHNTEQSEEHDDAN